jgi:hypothetical protein
MHARLTRIPIACATVSLALAAVLLGGCGWQGATGTINLQITDAPFPVDLISEATVTITEVKIRSAASQPSDEPAESAESELAEDGQDADGDEDPEAEESPWVTIFEGSKTFNLLDLRNGRTDLLADATVPAGTYTQMRLVVTEGSITLTDGRIFVMKVPSGAQSGIKLHFTFTVEEGETQPLLLDVNLARAFQPIPGSGVKRPEDITQFHFKPSLAMRLINVVQAGSITGTVTNAAGPLAGVTVAALRDGSEVTATTTEADGTYTLAGLPTGTYTVAFAAEGYSEIEVVDVAVTASQATEGVDVLMEASAPA